MRKKSKYVHCEKWIFQFAIRYQRLKISSLIRKFMSSRLDYASLKEFLCFCEDMNDYVVFTMGDGHNNMVHIVHFFI